MNDDETQDTGQAEEGASPELLALQAEVSALEDSAQAEQKQQQEAQQQTQIQANEAAILGALQMARMVAAPAFKWWPDFAACWSDSQLEQVANAGAQVMARHDITMGELMSEWGPYIALGVATIPPGLATYTAIKARRAELEAKPKGSAHERAEQTQD